MIFIMLLLNEIYFCQKIGLYNNGKIELDNPNKAESVKYVTMDNKNLK